MNRRYGSQPEISYRKLAKASGVSRQTIMRLVRLLEKTQ